MRRRRAAAAATGERTTQPVTTEHWAPLFFRPFRPIGVANNSHGLGPGYPPFTRFDRRTTIPEEPAETAATTTTTTEPPVVTPPPQSPPRWPIGRGHLPNPFRRRRDNGNVDASALERGEGTQHEGQS